MKMRCAICERNLEGIYSEECRGCSATWCSDDCSQETFVFNNKEFCTLCWENELAPPASEGLLVFALKKLKTTRKSLEREFSDKACVLKPENVYYCTFCPPETCASGKCEGIAEDVDWKFRTFRGVCCKTGIARFGVPAQELCDACIEWKRDRMVLLLGIRKYRTHTLLAKLPRDLLRSIIEKHILTVFYSYGSHKQGSSL